MQPYSLGVEEEYQLVDPGSGRLRSRARDVLAADWADELHPEVQETILEIKSRVCATAAELDDELRRLRFQVAATAASQELVPVAAGLHPFSRWEEQRPGRGERYRRLEERFGRVIRTEHIFGMHVHVAVPEGVDRVRIMNRMRRWIPHFVALAASSPRYEGEDTGYASYRTVLAGRLPCSGPPPAFADEAAYRAFTGALMEADTLEDRSMVYWSIRPHATYPTVELRACDVCPRVEDAVALAALARALVATLAQEEGDAAAAPPHADAALRADEWQAARHGLDARFVAGGREPVPAREGIGRLVEWVMPAAERLGDAPLLGGVGRILGRGSGADRMRACQAKRAELVGWLAEETVRGTGLDRRREGREA